MFKSIVRPVRVSRFSKTVSLPQNNSSSIPANRHGFNFDKPPGRRCLAQPLASSSEQDGGGRHQQDGTNAAESAHARSYPVNDSLHSPAGVTESPASRTPIAFNSAASNFACSFVSSTSGGRTRVQSGSFL